MFYIFEVGVNVRFIKTFEGFLELMDEKLIKERYFYSCSRIPDDYVGF